MKAERELAYAAAVNYADLLLCGCACGSFQKRGEEGEGAGYSILDRGAVKRLDGLCQIRQTKPLLLPCQDLPEGDQGGVMPMDCGGETMKKEEETERDKAFVLEDVSVLGSIVHSMQNEINMGDDAVDPVSS